MRMESCGVGKSVTWNTWRRFIPGRLLMFFDDLLRQNGLYKTGQSKPTGLGAPWGRDACMVGGRRCIWATQYLHSYHGKTLDFGGFVKPSALYSSANGGCIICCNWASAASEMPPVEMGVSLRALLLKSNNLPWYPEGTRLVPTKRKKVSWVLH